MLAMMLVRFAACVLLLCGLLSASPLVDLDQQAKRSAQSLKIQATAANQTGKAIATPFSAPYKRWESNATIGGQKLRLWLDTGSSDLWVYSTGIAADEAADHTLFDPTRSVTFENVSSSSFSIEYAGGMGASGYYGTDTVSIGGVTASELAVEVATSIDGIASNFDGVDGVLGLGFGKTDGASTPQKAFITALAPFLKQQVFTADLENSTSGTFELGYIDDTLYTGNLSTVAVDTSQGNWFVERVSFAAAGKDISNGSLSSISFDTGGEILSLDPEVAELYWETVPNSVDQGGGAWYYPCNQSLPSVMFHFNDTDSTIEIRGEVLDSLSFDVGEESCLGSVYGAGPFVGAPFFVDYFAVFDPVTPAFAFAPKPSVVSEEG
ncbi:hypothetical protein MMC10_002450 [Thelotrema lepadinum]|nr:hypothetical protein [Thelotrema lepadinum]